MHDLSIAFTLTRDPSIAFNRVMRHELVVLLDFVARLRERESDPLLVPVRS